jgi:hypothetical protein
MPRHTQQSSACDTPALPGRAGGESEARVLTCSSSVWLCCSAAKSFAALVPPGARDTAAGSSARLAASSVRCNRTASCLSLPSCSFSCEEEESGTVSVHYSWWAVPAAPAAVGGVPVTCALSWRFSTSTVSVRSSRGPRSPHACLGPCTRHPPSRQHSAAVVRCRVDRRWFCARRPDGVRVGDSCRVGGYRGGELGVGARCRGGPVPPRIQRRLHAHGAVTHGLLCSCIHQ